MRDCCGHWTSCKDCFKHLLAVIISNAAPFSVGITIRYVCLHSVPHLPPFFSGILTRYIWAPRKKTAEGPSRRFAIQNIGGLYTSWLDDHGFDSSQGEEGGRSGVQDDDISLKTCDSRPEGDIIILNPAKGPFLYRRGRSLNHDRRSQDVYSCIILYLELP